ncbi:MAG TPA: DEAD/DEAH box helicase [Acidimicrobiales bacterium]|nr:DEAD/DEAH box helicase [Acidimicrobiales bacterium]
MTTFGELGICEPLESALARTGVHSPFPIQALAIPDALAGRDVCGKAKTGSGKTLAFALPSIQRTAPGAAPKAPRVLVLVPTRELAAQVHGILDPLASEVGLRSVVTYGGQPIRPHIKALADGTDVLTGTPGRVIDLVDQRALSLHDIRTVVIDEADRMADMGFLPQVEWLLRKVTAPHQTMLFSATLDGDVGYLVRRYLADPVFHEVVASEPTVESMTHRFLAVHQMDKAKVAAAIIRAHRRTIVFCSTKRGADRARRDLADLGVKVGAIHGDLRQQQRERSLAAFAGGRLSALVATDVAARGIDVEGIDVVLHYDAAIDEKEYLHRSGRTARAGASGLAVSLLLWNEQVLAERICRRLGIDQPVVEVFSNDPRLSRLNDWDPASGDAMAVSG